ncbi:MAG TPA: energy transducer TonB [Candidatus Dormibacteraeota bacterium]|jgi:TonB family protein|nr:energy transducer TonB [Candidatus Dormibacteraeota bacterium]
MAMPQRTFELGILPERKIDRRALAASYAFMVVALLLLINLGVIFPDRLQLKQYRVTELIPLPALKPEPAPIKPKPVKLKTKLLPPAPVFDRPKLVVPHEVHRVHTTEPVEAPKVVMNQFAAPQIKLAAGGARPQLLHTGDFSGSSVAPTVNVAVQKVQTGGFGDPNGLKGEGKPNAKLYAAQAGGFDMPVGPGQGNGSGGAKGIKGTVASADFGNGVATGGRGDGRSSGAGVSTGGFGAEQVVHGGPKLAQADAGPATTPVEITFKPQPVYTDEARNLKLEGEVLLEVMFSANGTLHVNRVVRGLGHGLDEAAIAAANKMRFKPALRMGQPTDSTAVVHVLFQLAY